MNGVANSISSRNAADRLWGGWTKPPGVLSSAVVRIDNQTVMRFLGTPHHTGRMSHLLFFLCALVFAEAVATAQTPIDAAKFDGVVRRVTSVETRLTQLDDRVKKLASDGAVIFFFGAFCALWAQNTGRSAWLWFFLGLLFSVVTVIVLLVKNSNDRFCESLRVKLD